MGQTLTHGIYLPDEGERNCYDGLASNWQILDGSVGTIAAHTVALAGKAPAVHTHVKADITDFPAYGNTAGTICEGNDSRLSDARTPVAHTHGKADITDLFNSANEWTGINSFSQHQILQAGAYFYNSDPTAATSGLNLRNSKVTKGGTSDNGSQIIQFLDKDNKFLSQITTAKALSGTTQLQFNLGNIDSNNNSITGGITFSLAIDGTKQFIPGSNGTHNLGNGSYQWNNVYSKNYFYNGVAWGLDKTNTWTGNQYYTGMVILNSLSDVAEQFRQKLPKDVSTSSDALVRFNTLVDSAGHNVVVEALGHWASYVSKSITLKYKNDSAKQGSINFRLDSSGHGLFYPESPFECDLGNSDNKWKSLNGINPGALSFPDYNNVLDVTSEIPIASLDGNTQININDYLADKTGWLSIVIDDTAGNSIIVTQGKSGGATAFNNSRTFHTGAQSNGYISVFFPIIAGTSKIAFIKAASLIQMRFYYCLGNV